MEFGVVGFCFGGRKTGEPKEKASEQGEEPTANSARPAHIAPTLLPRTICFTTWQLNLRNH